jgi:hypothetical protein
MSVHGMMCHLRDGFAVALGEKTVRDASSLIQRTIIKWIALSSPLRWTKGISTLPEIEQGKGGTPPADFEWDRNALLLAVKRLSGDLSSAPIAHPVLGPLTPDEWRRWGYLHADHHLRQFGR